MTASAPQERGMDPHHGQFIHALDRLSSAKGVAMSDEVRQIIIETTRGMSTKDLHYYTMVYDKETRIMLAEQAREVTATMLRDLEDYPRYSPHRSQMSECGTYYM